MRIYFSFTIISIVVILLDLYVFKAIALITKNKIKNMVIRRLVFIAYWSLTFIALLLIGYLFSHKPNSSDLEYYNRIFIWLAISLVVFLPKLVILEFHIIDDIYHIMKLLRVKINKKDSTLKGKAITRKTFITQTGIALAAIPFIGSIYGVLKGRFDFHLINTDISFPNLPDSFNGFKIVQISDFHIGSFVESENEVERIVAMINSSEPDIVVFTGDMVNNLGREMDCFVDILANIESKYGKYAILGNHDYGDYTKWDIEEQKVQNHIHLKENIAKAGFQILLNENTEIEINGSSISLIGVENWGHPPFPRYGNLKKAMQGVDSDSLKILLSHDPSHWDAKVLGKTNIDLTLSGHTHGMQFGIDIPGFKWSPIQYKYSRWAGLYEQNNQYLYVNRGIGYIGLATRIGIRPEIAVIKLSRT